MAIIPDKTNTTEHLIEHSHKVRGKPRPYLGMSGLGVECMRKQWYGWHWAKIGQITVRMSRLFNRGHLEEASIITDLKSGGMKVFREETIDGFTRNVPMTGNPEEEQEEIVGFHKHCFGHPDGRIIGVIEAPKKVHLLEMKTMNDKYFNQLIEAITIAKQKKHIPIDVNTLALKTAFPVYSAQMNRYGGGMGLNRGLFVVTNKNDSSRKYMRVKLSKATFNKLVEREENIIMCEKPPPRKYKPDHCLCSWCGFYQICHLGADVAMNCRTCKSCDLEEDGEWSCSRKKKIITTEEQREGCNQYKRLF